MIAIYSRVSTGIQASEGTSLDGQIDLCLRKARQIGFPESEIQVYKEEGVSGEDADRPALNQLREDVAYGLITQVICTHPDRLSRNLADKLIVCEELKKNGVELIFVDTEYKDTPEGQLFFNMQSAIAEYELALIRKRTIRGKLNRVKKDNKIMPMRVAPYGYDLFDGTLKCNEQEAAFVRMIYEWYVYDNLTMRQIGERLQQLGAVPKRKESTNWNASSIRRILTSEVYIGNFYYNKRKSEKVRGKKTVSGNQKRTYEMRDQSDWVLVKVEPIVDVGIFELAQKQKERNLKTSKGNVKQEYLLKSLLKCGHCGRTWECTTYSGRANKQTGEKTKYPVYRCRGKNPRRYGEGVEKCEQSQSIRGDVLDNYVWKQVMEVILNPKTLEEDLSDQNTEIKVTLENKLGLLQKRSNAKEKEIARLQQLFIKGIINEDNLDAEFNKLDTEKHEIHLEIDKLQRQLDNQNKQLRSSEKLSEMTGLFRKYIESERQGKSTLTFQQKRHILEMLVDEVIVEFEGDNVALTYVGVLDELKQAKVLNEHLNDVDLYLHHQKV